MQILSLAYAALILPSCVFQGLKKKIITKRKKSNIKLGAYWFGVLGEIDVHTAYIDEVWCKRGVVVGEVPRPWCAALKWGHTRSVRYKRYMQYERKAHHSSKRRITAITRIWPHRKKVLFNDASRAHWFSYQWLLNVKHMVIVTYF